MKDLVFIGGAKGIGKSTVIGQIKKYADIEVINTGDIYQEAMRSKIDPEKAICDFLRGDYMGIVDTHYTGGYHNGGFSRGLSRNNLLSVSNSKSIDLILLDLDEDLLFTRRCEGKEEKYRDKAVMNLELKSNRLFFEEYCKDLSISGIKIMNTQIDGTVHRILERIQSGGKLK